MGEKARPQLRVVSPDATPEEVAAITAAVAASLQAAESVAAPSDADDGSRWVQVARLSGRRAGYSRGDWRLSGRLGRRSRA
jgi:Acyl-CoA carboxylase epsilon subunit